MKRNVVVILGLSVLASSGCGREANERFGTDRFVHAEKPGQEGPLSVSNPKLSPERRSPPAGASPAQQAVAAHGPSAGVRAQLLDIKAAKANSDVRNDVKIALREGPGSDLVDLPPEGMQVFGGWTSQIEMGRYQLSRFRLSRDAQFDRVVKLDDGGRENIRRYEVSFGGAEYAGWIEVRIVGARWVIVGAGSYVLESDPTEEIEPGELWIGE